MNIEYESNEKFRELCYIGDLELVKSYFKQYNPDLNSKNKVNGWTALHWAVSKNNLNLVKFLLDSGADKTIKNNDQKTPGLYAKDPLMKQLLCLESNVDLNNEVNEIIKSERTIIPNFVKHPQFHYADKSLYDINSMSNQISQPEDNGIILKDDSKNRVNESCLITIRLKSDRDEDFIEIDIDKMNTEFDAFKKICQEELNHNGIDYKINKIRKLPNILIRNTNDIRRLKNEQEIEVIFERI